MLKAWLSPRLRIWTFLTLANLVWLVAAWTWVERETWLWILPLALSINLLLFTYDRILQFRPLEGQPLVGNDPWGVLKLVHQLCSELNVTPPKVFLIAQPTAQIFSYARTRKQARLFITEGALHVLTPRQLRAVFIYQLIAIRASYSVLNYWMAAFLDLVFRAGKALEKGFAFIFGWAPPLAAWFIGPCLGLLHFFLIGGLDFRILDRETARLIESPEDLAQALLKMESYAQTQPWTEPWIFAHMCMVSPLSFRHTLNLFRVQPPLKSRIMSLTGRYPL